MTGLGNQDRLVKTDRQLSSERCRADAPLCSWRKALRPFVLSGCGSLQTQPEWLSSRLVVIVLPSRQLRAAVTTKTCCRGVAFAEAFVAGARGGEVRHPLSRQFRADDTRWYS